MNRRRFLNSAVITASALPAASTIVLSGITNIAMSNEKLNSDETTLMRVLHSIAASRSDNEAWDLMRRESSAFIWTDDEEPEATWNTIAARFGLSSRMRAEWANDGDPVFVFGVKRQTASLVRSREDRFIIIHALALAGSQSLELRYCRASAHSSDKAFALAPPKQWVMLDNGPLAEAAKRQFLRIPNDVKAFARLLYAPHSPPEWASSIATGAAAPPVRCPIQQSSARNDAAKQP